MFDCLNGVLGFWGLAKFVNKRPVMMKNTLGTKSKRVLSKDKDTKIKHIEKKLFQIFKHLIQRNHLFIIKKAIT